MLHIKTADNGFVLTETDDCDGCKQVSISVVERVDRGNEALEDAITGSTLVYDILEKLGLSGSKHDSHRLRLRIEDQDGNEFTDY